MRDRREFLLLTTASDALDHCARLSRKDGLDAMMDKDRLDAVVAPAGGLAGKTDPV
jgi:hypothetical protein